MSDDQRILCAIISLVSCALQTYGAEGGVKPTREVQEMIRSAYEAHKGSVTIPAGVYRVASEGPRAHIELEGMQNFEIRADGVTLLMDDPRQGGIRFSHCRNVTLKGATLSYAISPSTQGVVVGIASDGMSYDIRIDKGWPTNLDDAAYFKADPIAYLFDPGTRWWKRGALDLYAKGKPQRLGPDTIRVFWKRALGPPTQPVAIGDLVAFRGSGRQMVAIDDSAGMLIDQVTVLRAAGMAFREAGGEGNNRYNAVAVKRGPRMKGETTDPLLSATADGFHSNSVRRGPTVENSYFEAMTDDGIAIHGHFMMVFRAQGNHLTVNENVFRAGDPLELYRPDGQPAGEATVTAVGPVSFVNTERSRRLSRTDHLDGPYFDLTLNKPLQAGFDYLVEDTMAIGAGYVLRNNQILHHRARGMILKSHDGLVEHNVIDGSTMSALLMAPEFWWNEAGYNRNVIVRDNTFKNCPVAPKSLGVVVLTAMSDQAGKAEQHPLGGYGHRHIIFKDNRFENDNGVNLLITSAQDVTVEGNVFSHSQTERYAAAGQSWGEDASALINIAQATRVTLRKNKVIDQGGFVRSYVKLLAGADVTGADSGVERSGRR